MCDSSLRALRGGDVLVDCIVDVDVDVIAVDVDVLVDVDVDVLDCDCNDNGDSKGCPIVGKAATAAAAGTVVLLPRLRATMRLVVSRWHCCSQIAMAASQSARDSWYRPAL